MVSGGFDPIHVGHIRLFKEAAKHGRLIVAINSDEWLMKKKNSILTCFKDRAEIITSLRCVWIASGVNDADGSVCEALRRLKPTYFANRGNKALACTLNTALIPEIKLCDELGIKLLWNIGEKELTKSWGRADAGL